VPGFDLVVVGAGMVGLATALAAAARRLRVLVIDREAQANECSWLRAPELAAVLHSMTELRVESRGRAANCGVAFGRAWSDFHAQYRRSRRRDAERAHFARLTASAAGCHLSGGMTFVACTRSA